MKAPAIALMFGHKDDGEDEDESGMTGDDKASARDDAFMALCDAMGVTPKDPKAGAEALDAYLDLRDAGPGEDESADDSEDSGPGKHLFGG